MTVCLHLFAVVVTVRIIAFVRSWLVSTLLGPYVAATAGTVLTRVGVFAAAPGEIAFRMRRRPWCG